MRGGLPTSPEEDSTGPETTGPVAATGREEERGRCAPVVDLAAKGAGERERVDALVIEPDSRRRDLARRSRFESPGGGDGDVPARRDVSRSEAVMRSADLAARVLFVRLGGV